jgi:quercetin dioxygenase-like cupin family protein
MRVMRVAVALLILVAGGKTLAAQDTVFFPAPDRIAIRYLPSIPIVDVAPHAHVHTVVGATGSVSFGEFDSSGVAPLHHHTREQVDVGLSGRFDMTIGANVESLASGTGVIVPANVNHSIANNRADVATAVEFHTVRRPDLVPPRPSMKFPASEEPARVPGDRRLISRMDSGGGEILNGETCTVRWRRLSQPVDVHNQASATELFVYVARGTVRLAAAGSISMLSPGTVVIVPGTTRNVMMSAAGSEDAAVIEFEVRAP